MLRFKRFWPVSFCLFLTIMLGLPSTGAALECHNLAPQRPIESEVRAKLEGGTGGLLLNQLGSLEFEGEIQKIENDLVHKYPNADKLHMFNSVVYMLCSMLDESDFNDEIKFEKFEDLANKWMMQSSSFIVDQIKSDNPTEKRSAIETGIKHQDAFIREMVIEDALKSESNALKSIALQNIFIDQVSFGGFVCDGNDENPYNGCIHSFGFNIEEMSQINGSVRFKGNFTGSIFDSHHSETRQAAGNLSGTKLSVNSKKCSLNVSLAKSSQMHGAFDCGTFILKGEWARGTRPVVLQLY